MVAVEQILVWLFTSGAMVFIVSILTWALSRYGKWQIQDMTPAFYVGLTSVATGAVLGVLVSILGIANTFVNVLVLLLTIGSIFYGLHKFFEMDWKSAVGHGFVIYLLIMMLGFAIGQFLQIVKSIFGF